MLIRSAALDGREGLAHAFFTRAGGASQGIFASLNGGLGSGDERAAVLENRRRMAQALGVAQDGLVSLNQVHSADAVIVETPWAPDARPKADGMATRTPGIALAIATADCGPLLLADPEARVVGAAHAGWRGALGGVIEATLDAMERLGARRGRVVAALGPTISQAAYEVGPELVEAFAAGDSRSGRFFRPAERPGKSLFDLPGYVLSRLERAGVAQAESLGRCTYAEEDLFYSYRRATHRGEPDYGRLIAAIAVA